MRLFKKNPEQIQKSNPLGTTRLPVEYPAQIYPRVSSREQMENVSTEMQQDKSFAVKCGWPEDIIIMDTDDLGLSGRLRMEDRPAFTKMLRRIVKGEIRAVIAAQVDRLFRDKWGAEYAKFMEICHAHKVVVVTPEMVYDFSVDWHVKMFRNRCEQAADYLNYQIEKRLIAAKHYLASKGLWEGGNLPAGYDVDRDKRSSTYRKYIPYWPHAEVVDNLFRMYWDTGGDFMKVFREIDTWPYVFPSFDLNLVDIRTVKRCVLKKVDDGYGLSTSGLKSILTNPAYFGIWVFNGTVLFDNHEKIITNPTVFWFAFNRLSDYGLDGSPMEKSEHRIQRRRKDVPEPTSVLKEIITTSKEGYEIYYSRNYRAGEEHPIYMMQKLGSGVKPKLFSIPVEVVDGIFLERFFERLRQSNEFEDYRTRVEKIQEDLAQEQHDLQVQVNAVRSRMTSIEKSLEKVMNERLVEKLDQEYTNLEEELERLQTLADVPTMKRQQSQQMLEFRDLIPRIEENWPTLNIERSRMLITTFTELIYLDQLSPYYFRLMVHWRDPHWGTEEKVFYRSNTPCKVWTDYEDDVIKMHYPNMEKDELMEILHSRSWMQVIGHASGLGVRRHHKDERTERDTISWDDFGVIRNYRLMQGGDSEWSTCSPSRMCALHLDYQDLISRLLYILNDELPNRKVGDSHARSTNTSYSDHPIVVEA